MSAERLARQSFLGPESEKRIARSTIGVCGLGGGGSHIIQQLAHIGFRRFVIYDGDVVEESNLNRLVGAKTVDAAAETPKIHIAKMMVYGLEPQATVRAFPCRWQDNPEPLRECQIVFGCVDSYQGRAELEVACRRYLMHYIDIGMDVHGSKQGTIGGQVVLSSPGGPCMRCVGFLDDEKIQQEVARYGKAGARPQVVWPNGVLASTAVGLAVDLVTGWTSRPLPYVYLVYDGNRGTVVESKTVRNLIISACPHFSSEDVGDPIPIKL
jgi:hypothetical protein